MPKINDLNELIREKGIAKGSWKLDSHHNLRYQSQDNKEEYVYEASLVAAEAGALVVSVVQKQEGGSVVTSLAKLNGTWQANKKNQFEFEIEGQKGKNDKLSFTGDWKIGKNNEIVYEYQTRKATKTKKSEIQTLTFKGFWDLSRDKRLTYLIEGDTDSAFRFRGAFQTPSILAKKGEIRYQLGAEVSGKLKSKQKKATNQTITLFGKWKLSDKFGLSFEIEYEDAIHEIRFGAEYSLTPDLQIAAKLTHPEAGPLGVELILTKDFGAAQSFLRLRRALQENAIEAGITIPW